MSNVVARAVEWLRANDHPKLWLTTTTRDLMDGQMTDLTTVCIDVSHWNGEIDFNAVAASGIAAVIAKAGQGTRSVDPMWEAYSQQIQDAGLLLGAYLFMDGSDGAAQADHLISITGGTIPLFLDAEQNAASQSTAQIVAAAAQRIKDLRGVWPTIYTGRYGPTGDRRGLPNAILSQCPLWLAAYNDHPVCPPGWDHWNLWQYTDKADIDGMPAPCDASRFAGTVDEFKAWWRSLTMAAPQAPILASQPIEPGLSPADMVAAIKLAQSYLASIGLYAGKVDGSPGPQTQGALAAYWSSKTKA